MISSHALVSRLYDVLFYLLIAALVAPASVGAATPGGELGKLAYIQDGDVWARNLPDGEPRRVTEDGNNASPRWSPSGHWLAFRQGKQLWLTGDPPGQRWAVNEGVDVDAFYWSPADDHLAYVTGAGELRLINVGAALGADPTANPVSIPTAGWTRRLAWSPDGQWLAYDTDQITTGESPQRSAGLWRVRANGSDVTAVYTTGSPAQDGLVAAGWSPDGQSVLFRPDPYFSASILADGVPLNVIPATGGQPHEVAPAMLLHPSYLSTTARGNRLAVVVGAGRETWTNKRLVVIDLDTGAQHTVTGPETAATQPSFSPDGAHLAYVSAPDAGSVGGGEAARLNVAQRRIWMAQVDGSTPRQLTNEADFRDERPLWSADGAQILFARIDLEGRATIWLAPAEGGRPRPVVDELTPAPDWFGYYGYVEWGDLFDWWRGSADQQALARAAAVAAWPTYSDAAYRISLQYPEAWKSRPDYGGVRYEGPDGFFSLNASSGQGLTLNAVADLETHQQLQPYGSNPEITSIEVQSQPARLILPSSDQPAETQGQAALVVQYPQPITLEGTRYRFLVLYADRKHIQDLASTLHWLAP